jgi:hypothetical protein
LNIATAFALATGQTAQRKELPRVAEMSKYVGDLSTTRTKMQRAIEQYLAKVQVVSNSQPSTTTELTLTELCNGVVCRQFASSDQ